MSRKLCNIIAACLCVLSTLVYCNDLQMSDLVDQSKTEFDTVLSPDELDFKVFASPDELDKFLSANLTEVLSNNNIDVSKDALERAGKFEGDIAGHTSNDINEYVEDNSQLGRNAIRNRWQLWPGGKIPYVLSSQYGAYARKVIGAAMTQFHQYTCVRFVPRIDHDHYIHIKPSDGCYSLVGRIGLRQTVSVDVGCLQVGTVLHELMHVAGFFHEQSRSDRDDYIKIVWDNVQEDAKDQFEKYGWDTITHLGTEYDYGSLMHYSPYAFSNGKGKSIQAVYPGSERMGQRDGFSATDVEKINALYQCEAKDIAEEFSPSATEPPRPIPTIHSRPRPAVKKVTTAAVATACEDASWKCFFKRVAGWCTDDYRTQMECPSSCNRCHLLAAPKQSGQSSEVVTGNCIDAETECVKWLSLGYCERHPSFMGEQCRRSCGLCSIDPFDRQPLITTPRPRRETEPPLIDEDCEDKVTDCAEWIAKKDSCVTFEDYMRTNCRRSCKFCWPGE